MNKYNPSRRQEKILTFKQREEVIKKHFEEGISQTQLAKDYGVSRQTISRYYCRPHGDSPLTNFKMDDKELVRLYTEDKKSVLQIANQFGTSTTPIKKRLKLAGVKKRISQREKWRKEIPFYHFKMRTWVGMVIGRDGMKCKKCNAEYSKGNRIIANHIIPVRDIQDPKLLFDVNNGITLCDRCHYKIHFHEKEYEQEFRNLIQTISSV